MWPVEFIQCYLEDSFGARLWCDDSSVAVRLFVAQLLTFFSNDDSAPTRYADTSSRAPIVQYVIDQSRYVLEHDLTALPAVLKTLTPLAGVGAVRELAALHLRAWLRDTPPLAALARTLALGLEPLFALGLIVLEIVGVLLAPFLHAGQLAGVLALGLGADLLTLGILVLFERLLAVEAVQRRHA